jgi:hypothetical protein
VATRASQIEIGALLSSLHAGSHTGRSLLSHLRGTQALLRSWGNPPSVCLGGLFHSVYGTQSYIQSISYSRRQSIRQIIGPRAELLAYLFCIADRRTFFDESIKSRPSVHDRLTRRTIPVSPKVMRALAEIEAANYVEFLPHTAMRKRELRDFRAKIESAKSVLTAGAYRAALRSLRSREPHRS